MPTFRGIEVSIVAGSDNTVFPEFPHPDGSSIKLSGLQSSRQGNSIFHSPRRSTEAVDRLPEGSKQHADPKISVYIPSAPDTNFFFRYYISEPPAGHKFILFRITINGRFIMSFGIDLAETTVGAAHQALFEPSKHYQHNDNGVLMTQYGIESRCFRFISYGKGDKSIGHDGGLIQVQVYRAKGRRRVAPEPTPYRGNDNYGVALISNGLLENPQAAFCYDYALFDPIQAPYATFKFHYRSWENLQLLHLAPPLKPEFLCPSPAKANGDGANVAGGPVFDFSEGARRHVTDRAGCLIRGDYVVTPSAVGFEAGGLTGKRRERPLPQPPTARPHVVDARYHAEANAALDNVLLLKCAPPDDTPKKRESARIEELRKLSAAFHGPPLPKVPRAPPAQKPPAPEVSIAKSLEAYADGGGNFAVDTVELGSAVKKETVYRGKAPTKANTKVMEKEEEKVTLKEKETKEAPPKADRDDFASPDDGVFLFEGDESPKKGEDNPAIPIERLALSPLKTTPKTIYVAPFTDSLRKREMPKSPTRDRGRRVSHDPTLRSGESSRRGRAHGGSLDSRPQTFLDQKLGLEDQ